MKAEEIYIQLALNYRLSLKSMQKILKMSETEIHQKLFNYDGLKYYGALQFLFGYDAINENEIITYHKEEAAKNFLKQYKKGDKTEKQNLLLSLIELDKNFRKVMEKAYQNIFFTKFDYMIISKYRIKYAISQLSIMNEIGKTENGLSKFERKIEDPKIKKKLEVLNSYYCDLKPIHSQKCF